MADNKAPDFDHDVYVVTVDVRSARHLPAADVGGTSDPYVIVKASQQSKQTEIIKKTLTPEWNQTFTFLLEKPEVLKFDVYDWDRLSSDELLGDCELNTADLFANDTPFDGYIPLKNVKLVKKSKAEINVRVVCRKVGLRDAPHVGELNAAKARIADLERQIAETGPAAENARWQEEKKKLTKFIDSLSKDSQERSAYIASLEQELNVLKASGVRASPTVLEEENVALKDKNLRAESALAESAQSLAVASAKLQSVELKLQESIESNHKLKADASQAEGKYEAVLAELNAAKAELLSTSDALKNQSSKVLELTAANEASGALLQRQIADLQAELSTARESHSKQIEDVKSALAKSHEVEIVSLRSDFDAEVAKLRAAFASSEQGSAESAGKLSAILEENAKLKSSIIEQERKLNQLTSDLQVSSTFKDKLFAAEAALGDRSRELESAQFDLKQRDAKLVDLEGSLAQVRDRVNVLEVDVSNKNRELEEIKQAHSREVDEVRNSLRSSHDAQLLELKSQFDVETAKLKASFAAQEAGSSEAATKLAAVMNENISLSRAVEDLERKASQLASELEQAANLKDKLLAAESSLAIKTRDLDNSQFESKEKDNTIAGLQASSSNYQFELSSVRERVSSLEESLAKKDQELESSRQDYARQLDELRSSLTHSHVSEIASLKSKYESETAKLQSALGAHEAGSSESVSKLSALMEENIRLSRAVEELEHKSSHLLTELEQARPFREKLLTVEASLAEKIRELDSALFEVKDKEGKIATLAGAAASAQIEFSSLRDRLKALEDLIASKDQELANVRQESARHSDELTMSLKTQEAQFVEMKSQFERDRATLQSAIDSSSIESSSKMSSLVEENSRLKQELEKTSNDLVQERGKLVLMESSISQFQQDSSNVSKDLDALRSELARKAEELEDSKRNHARERQILTQELNNSHQFELESAIRSVEAQLRQEQVAVQEKEAQLRESEAKFLQIDVEVKSLQEELVAAKKRIFALEDDIAKKDGDLERSREDHSREMEELRNSLVLAHGVEKEELRRDFHVESTKLQSSFAEPAKALEQKLQETVGETASLRETLAAIQLQLADRDNKIKELTSAGQLEKNHYEAQVGALNEELQTLRNKLDSLSSEIARKDEEYRLRQDDEAKQIGLKLVQSQSALAAVEQLSSESSAKLSAALGENSKLSAVIQDLERRNAELDKEARDASILREKLAGAEGQLFATAQEAESVKSELIEKRQAVANLEASVSRLEKEISAARVQDDSKVSSQSALLEAETSKVRALEAELQTTREALEHEREEHSRSVSTAGPAALDGVTVGTATEGRPLIKEPLPCCVCCGTQCVVS
eukprot:TRINITY_DN4076_c0_g1_i1.p1 TRINITY_DN4076_c0_g1~~TRINITY_DN4076_c0_g1_i1.p1  ORF type:complete len:1349 (+),score=476.66 TRINITY_DN4076_c0_g1_i1:26-4072(+)